VDTHDYMVAPGGDGPEAANWADKPHRLVYDLCAEIDRLNGKLPLTGPAGWCAGPFCFRLVDYLNGMLVTVELQTLGGRSWLADEIFPRAVPRCDIMAAMNRWAREKLQTWLSQLPGERNEG
jgi:hypothetical protein